MLILYYTILSFTYNCFTSDHVQSLMWMINIFRSVQNSDSGDGYCLTKMHSIKTAPFNLMYLC